MGRPMEVGRFDAIRTGRLARGENSDGIALSFVSSTMCVDAYYYR